MATLKDLGLSVDDYLAYIRGAEIDPAVEKLIDEHWPDVDFPFKIEDRLIILKLEDQPKQTIIMKQKQIEEKAKEIVESTLCMDAVIGMDAVRKCAETCSLELSRWLLENLWIKADDETPNGKKILAVLSEKFTGLKGLTEVLEYVPECQLVRPSGYYDNSGENVPLSAIIYWMPIPSTETEQSHKDE